MDVTGMYDEEIYEMLLQHPKYGAVAARFSSAWYQDKEFTLLTYIIWSSEISLAKDLINGGIMFTGTDYYYFMDASDRTLALLKEHFTNSDDRFSRLWLWIQNRRKFTWAENQQQLLEL